MNWYVALFFLVLGLMPAIYSYRIGIFSEKQLVQHNNLSSYTRWSFTTHFGAWYDIIVLPWVLGFMAAHQINKSDKDGFVIVLASLLLTAILHWVWTKSNDSDHNISEDGQLTFCGWLHVIYMFVGLAIVISFYHSHLPVTDTQLVLIGTAIMGLPAVSPLLLEAYRYRQITLLNVFFLVLTCVLVIWRTIS